MKRLLLNSGFILFRVKNLFLRKLFELLSPIRDVVFLLDSAYKSTRSHKVECLNTTRETGQFLINLPIKHFKSRDFSPQYVVTAKEVAVDSLIGNVFESPRTLIAESSIWPHDYLMRTFIAAPSKLQWKFLPRFEKETLLLPSSGYYHWIIEDLPNYLKALNSRKSYGAGTLIFAGCPRYVKEALDHLSLEFMEVPRFFVSSGHSFCTFGQDLNFPRPSSLKMVRDYFGCTQTEGELKIYVSRRNSSRSPLWEKELEIRLLHDGWDVIFSEKMPFLEQIKFFSSASIVCGVHGANLANSVFQRPGSNLIELTPISRDIPGIDRISSLLKLEYSEILFDDKDSCDEIYRRIKTVIS